MRATIGRIGLAALAVFSAACSDHRDLLAPPTKISTALRPPGPCGPMPCPTPPPNEFLDVSAGTAVTCAAHTLTKPMMYQGLSNVTCWGSNELGMLGTGSASTTEKCPGLTGTQIDCSTVPVTIAGGHFFASVSVGVDQVCAVESGTMAAFCWGQNGSGQLGIAGGNTFTPTTPVPGFAFSSVAAGANVSCGISTAQALVCWGAGFGGGTPSVVSAGISFRSVSVERDLLVCGLDVGGSPCSGTRLPYDIIGQANTARHICQIFGGGQTECYGDNSSGQLGLSPSTPSLPDYKPNVIQGFTFQSVATGYDHTCALNGANAFCWGSNYYGQLGASASYPLGTPKQVQPASGTTLTFTKVSVGEQHTCGLANGGIFCWGRNDLGQLGIGTLSPVLVPGGALAVGTPSRVAGT
jgi:alpha-tubulin suppressor-like RCC1 family protein